MNPERVKPIIFPSKRQHEGVILAGSKSWIFTYVYIHKEDGNVLTLGFIAAYQEMLDQKATNFQLG